MGKALPLNSLSAELQNNSHTTKKPVAKKRYLGGGEWPEPRNPLTDPLTLNPITRLHTNTLLLLSSARDTGARSLPPKGRCGFLEGFFTVFKDYVRILRRVCL